jgi:hypothetical protein
MRAPSGRATLLAVSAGLASGCGLLFAPGDLLEPGPRDPVAGAGADGGASDDATAAPAAPDARSDDGPGIIVVAGRRTPVEGEPSPAFVTETIRIVLDADGGLAPLRFGPSPPAAAAWTSAILAGGSLLVQQGEVVYRGARAAAAPADWTTHPLHGPGLGSGARPWVFDAGLVSAGGLGSVPADNVTVQVAPFNAADGGMDPFRALARSKLVRARGDVTLLRTGAWFYAIGGRDSTLQSAPAREEVEVAPAGADGLPGEFAATQRLVDPSTGKEHGVSGPIVAAGAGHLFVLGGLTTGQSSSVTDVALAAPIDAATGKLGAWTALPRLPARLRLGCAVVVEAGTMGPREATLVVLGGQGDGGFSDAVLALALLPGGGTGSWRRAGTLPGPRTGVACVVE